MLRWQTTCGGCEHASNNLLHNLDALACLLVLADRRSQAARLAWTHVARPVLQCQPPALDAGPSAGAAGRQATDRQLGIPCASSPSRPAMPEP